METLHFKDLGVVWLRKQLLECSESVKFQYQRTSVGYLPSYKVHIVKYCNLFGNRDG